MLRPIAHHGVLSFDAGVGTFPNIDAGELVQLPDQAQEMHRIELEAGGVVAVG